METPDYMKSQRYWSNVKGNIDGMLGGHAYCHSPDVFQSKSFIEKHGPSLNLRRKALDCGAGIGRITKSLLLPLFDTVDMLEPSLKFLTQAESYIGEYDFKRVTNTYPCGLQDFEPVVLYDLIWVQWCSIYLTDEDFVKFLCKCKTCLAPDNPSACIVLKENYYKVRKFDPEDSSVTRTLKEIKDIVSKSGLVIKAEELQKDFPSILYPVKMFCFVP